MSEFMRALIDLFSAVWPFRVVSTWQKGAVYVFGRYQGWVGPGCYPFVPFFSEITAVSVVPAPWPTPLLSISLKDDRVLSYSAMVTLQVADVDRALNSVAEFSETCMEIVSGLLSERLADEDPKRFRTARGNRDRLIEELRAAAEEKTLRHGVRVLEISFPNFTVGVRAFRLLTDRSTFSETQIGVQ